MLCPKGKIKMQNKTNTTGSNIQTSKTELEGIKQEQITLREKDRNKIIIMTIVLSLLAIGIYFNSKRKKK